MTIGERIKNLRMQFGLTQEQLAKMASTTKQTIYKYENNIVTNIPLDRLSLISTALRTDTSYLLGWNEEKKYDKLYDDSNCYELSENKVFQIPVFDSVSAGFGSLACDYIVGYTPLYIENAADAKQTICINVKGDSMFPKIENGDTIQVRKQTSVDSGSIAVVLLDGDEGLVKKVVYDDNSIELHSINPMYQVMRFAGREVQRIEVVGLVKTVIKHL